MIRKKYPIKILEQALEYEEKQLEECQQDIKSLRDRATKINEAAMTCIAGISGLKDALHKLKGLDNLEKKNKIADPAGFVVKDVTGFDVHKFARELILPDIIEMLKDRKFTFREELEKAIE